MVRGLRLTAMKALPLIAAELADAAQLLFGLDALGDDLQADTVRQCDDRAHDRFVGAAGGEVAHKAAIDPLCYSGRFILRSESL